MGSGMYEIRSSGPLVVAAGPVTAMCMPTFSRQSVSHEAHVLSEHQRPQRYHPRQHSNQHPMVALRHTTQRQMRQIAEPRPVLQLHILKHPAA